MEKLRLDQQKLVLDDDRARDVEELKAATGFQRDNPMERQLAPAVPYPQIMAGADPRVQPQQPMPPPPQGQR